MNYHQIPTITRRNGRYLRTAATMFATAIIGLIVVVCLISIASIAWLGVK
jgi:hypothetical protein